MRFKRQSLWEGLNLLTFKKCNYSKSIHNLCSQCWCICKGEKNHRPVLVNYFPVVLLSSAPFMIFPSTPCSLDSVGSCKSPRALLLPPAPAAPEEQRGGQGVDSEVEMGGLVPSICNGEQGHLPSLCDMGSPYLIQAGCSQVCARKQLRALTAAWSPVYTNGPAAFISGGATLGYFWHKS